MRAAIYTIILLVEGNKTAINNNMNFQSLIMAFGGVSLFNSHLAKAGSEGTPARQSVLAQASKFEPRDDAKSRRAFFKGFQAEKSTVRLSLLLCWASSMMRIVSAASPGVTMRWSRSFKASATFR